MSKARTYAQCTLFAIVGFGAGQLSPFPRRSSRASPSPSVVARSERALAPPAPHAPPAPPAPAETSLSTAPSAIAPTVERSRPPDAEPQPAPAAPASASRAPLLSSFRFRGIGPHGGLELARVPRGSLADLLGLRTGDEVITLNGLHIADPQQALQAYARLPHVDDWIARIHRNGALTEIRYALR